MDFALTTRQSWHRLKAPRPFWRGGRVLTRCGESVCRDDPVERLKKSLRAIATRGGADRQPAWISHSATRQSWHRLNAPRPFWRGRVFLKLNSHGRSRHAEGADRQPAWISYLRNSAVVAPPEGRAIATRGGCRSPACMDFARRNSAVVAPPQGPRPFWRGGRAGAIRCSGLLPLAYRGLTREELRVAKSCMYKSLSRNMLYKVIAGRASRRKL